MVHSALVPNLLRESLALNMDFNDHRQDTLMGSASFALNVLEQDATWEDTSCNILKDGKERGELLFAGLIFLSGQ